MEEIFAAEFIIHEVQCNLPYISKPAMTIRFLEFPTLTVFGTYQKSLIFNKGKSCKFSMNLTTLRESLKRFPLYLMLVDALPQNVKMLGTAAVDLSAFAESGISQSVDYKRNFINLQDPIKNNVARLDISISISIVSENSLKTPSEIFEKINYEKIKIGNPENLIDKSIGTDPFPMKIPGKVMNTTGTMTVEKAEVKEVQTSVFEENFNPPPMFFTKTKAPVKPVYYPTVPVKYEMPVIEEQNSDSLIDKLIREIQQLKQVSALQQNWSYPPIITLKNEENVKNDQKSNDFEKKSEKNTRKSGSKSSSKSEYESDSKEKPLSKRSSKVQSARKSNVKESVSEYSEDFEDVSESFVKSSSRDDFTKCFVCGELVKRAEAQSHPNNCKKNRDKGYSPQVESGDTWGRDLVKSVTSIAEEYESDFQEESESQN